MSAVTVKGALGTDPHSYANYEEVAVTHMAMDLEIDFSKQVFRGSVALTLTSKKDNVSVAVLDTRALKIHSVSCLTEGNSVTFSIPKTHPKLGEALQLTFGTALSAGSVVVVKVSYETTEESGGLQWLAPEQTTGGQYPFVFTQFQAIQARSGLPCMDTPSCKTPFSARLTVAEPLVALTSGQPELNADGTKKVERSNGKATYFYDQTLPVPVYLIAIVAGNMKSEKVSERSEIFAEPELLPAAVKEFGDELENYIQITEKLTGIPYLWKTYNVAILPYSYAYGGMENVCLTFLNASLLVGDKSLVDVAAHEIAHSWSGNDATNATWVDFWLNEGFTMYLERLILGATVDEEYRKFQIMLGYLDLVQTVDFLKDDPPSFASLQPQTVDTDPDDAFSIVPYEKGCLFVYFLEQLVGGKEAMCGWLNKLYLKYQFSTYTTADLKNSFLEYFSANGVSAEKLASIDWNHWINEPGLPNWDPTDALKTSLGDASIALANRWIAAADDPSLINASIDDIASFKPAQIMYFVDTLSTASKQLSPSTFQKLEDTYHLFTSNNPEIAYRILTLALKNNVPSVLQPAIKFVAKQGRGRYAKPVYAAFRKAHPEVCKSTYAQYRATYQAVVRTALDNIVGH
jgi:leukotriene-A4 hydrolase